MAEKTRENQQLPYLAEGIVR